MNGNKKNMNKGAAILFSIFALLFFVLFVRFLTIQVSGKVDGHVLKNEALQKYLRTDVLEAKRGTIYDQKGNVIAEDTSSFTLVAILDDSMSPNPKEPKHVTNPERTAKVLEKYIDLDKDEIERILTKRNKDGKPPFQVEFGKAGRNLSNKIKKSIEDEHLPGITFMRGSKRFYPNGKFASHLIGFAQKSEEDNHSMTGQMGIEKTYEKYLKGTNGKIQYKSDIWGYLLPGKKEMVKDPKNGDGVYLTIDTKIQTFLEDALNEVEKQYKPAKAFGIVADAKTGAILAMSQRPSFHPGTREGLDQNWQNDLVEYSFEPGSTFKTFTLAAAIEEGAFNSNAYYQSGSYKVGPNVIRDHNGGNGWGSISYLEGVQRSSNVAMASLLEKMGPDVFRQYLDDFRFGQKTGIGLPNEATGSILYRYPVEKVTTSFGQGTTTTALQMIQAATAVTNGGKMMKPYVIDQIVDEQSKEVIVDNKPKVIGEPISKETAKQVLDVLETVISSEHGTGQAYQIQGYEVAGKTGTAQMPNPKGGYLKGSNNYIFSFLGMAPKDDPKLIVYTAVAQPQLADEGGSAPVSKLFNPVMKNSLQYLNIEPKQGITVKTIKLQDWEKKKKEAAVKSLKQDGAEPIVIGKGQNIVGQLPKPGTELLRGEKVILKTDGESTIPDLTGWSLRDVTKLAKLADIRVSFTGEGYVQSQNMQPGIGVKPGQKLIVTLKKPKEKSKK